MSLNQKIKNFLLPNKIVRRHKQILCNKAIWKLFSVKGTYDIVFIFQTSSSQSLF